MASINTQWVKLVEENIQIDQYDGSVIITKILVTDETKNLIRKLFRPLCARALTPQVNMFMEMLARECVYQQCETSGMLSLDDDLVDSIESHSYMDEAVYVEAFKQIKKTMEELL